MHKDLAKAISTYEDRHKAEARAKLEAVAKEVGYSFAELVGTAMKTTRAPAPAKYRHPENPALTWSGRGRKAAAIAYTLIETAKLNAVDPHAWLADTLARIPDHKINKVDDLLPWKWNG